MHFLFYFQNLYQLWSLYYSMLAEGQMQMDGCQQINRLSASCCAALCSCAVQVFSLFPLLRNSFCHVKEYARDSYCQVLQAANSCSGVPRVQMGHV